MPHAQNRTAVVLSGGLTHDFATTTDCLAEVLAEDGWRVRSTEDALEFARGIPDAGLAVLNTLRWTMRRPERYADRAAAHGFRTPPALRAAVAEHLGRGRGVLALHTAPICFDDWPEWPGILGAHWDWDTSFHPPAGPLPVRVCADAGPLVAGLTDFVTVDEAYSRLTHHTDDTPLLTADVDGHSQPLAWCRTHGGGRVAYDALGHEAASYRPAPHRTLLRRLAAWATDGLRE